MHRGEHERKHAHITCKMQADEQEEGAPAETSLSEREPHAHVQDAGRVAG